MAEYVVTPGKKDIPEGTHLMDELHRRGFTVEINVKGPAQQWDAIRFYEQGPPEIECFLSRDEDNGKLNVSVAVDAPPEATELQLNLIDLILSELRGQADNTTTRERFTPQQFTAKLKSFHGSSHETKELFWIAFSWVVVVFSLLIWVFSPPSRSVAPVIVFLSLLSAAGLTYSYFKS